MQTLVKILALPAGLALAGIAPAHAAPGTVVPPAATPAEADVARPDSTVTPVHHTWRHTRDQQWRRYHRRHYAPPPRYYYGPPRYYGPRCYWSRYYQQRICR